MILFGKMASTLLRFKAFAPMMALLLFDVQALQLIEDRGRSEHSSGHLPTMLKGLDETLQGVPFGCLTELVGPAGIGKTQVKNKFF